MRRYGLQRSPAKQSPRGYPADLRALLQLNSKHINEIARILEFGICRCDYLQMIRANLELCVLEKRRLLESFYGNTKTKFVDLYKHTL